MKKWVRMPGPSAGDTMKTATSPGIELLEIRPVYENRFCTIFDDRVRVPSGAEGTYVRALWKATYSVAVLPVLADGRVPLIRCFRHAVRDWLLEVPKGFGEPGRSVEENATRELREEMGLEAGTLVRLGPCHADPGMIGNPIECLVAWDCREVGSAQPEVFESLQRIEPLTVPEIGPAIAAGTITDAVTMMLLLRHVAGLLPSPTRHSTP